MRRIGFVVMLCTGFFVASIGPVAGQARFDGTAFAGGAFFLNNLAEFGQDLVQSHDNSFGFGAHVGVRLSKISIEGTVALVPTEITTKDASGSFELPANQSITILTANVLYNMPINFNWEGFLGVGAGIKNYSADDPIEGQPICTGGAACPAGFKAGSDFTFSVGGGFRLHFADAWSARLDVRDYISTFDAFEETSQKGEMTKLQNDLLVTLGFSFSPPAG